MKGRGSSYEHLTSTNDLIHQLNRDVCGAGSAGRSVPLLALEGKFRTRWDEGAEVMCQDSAKESYYSGNLRSEVPREQHRANIRQLRAPVQLVFVRSGLLGMNFL